MNFRHFLTKCMGGICVLESGGVCFEGELSEAPALDKRTISVVFKRIVEMANGKPLQGSEKKDYKMSFDIKKVKTCNGTTVVFIDTLDETITFKTPDTHA